MLPHQDTPPADKPCRPRYSLAIDLWKLERETAKYFYLGLFLAILLYGGMAAFFRDREQPPFFIERRGKMIETDLHRVRTRVHTGPYVLNAPEVPLRMPSRKIAPVSWAWPSGKGAAPDWTEPELFRDDPVPARFDAPAFGAAKPDAGPGMGVSGETAASAIAREVSKTTPIREGTLAPEEDFIPSADRVIVHGNVPAIWGFTPILAAVFDEGDPVPYRAEDILRAANLTLGGMRRSRITDTFRLNHPILFVSLPEETGELGAAARYIGEYIRSGGFAFIESSSGDQSSAREFIVRALGPECQPGIIPYRDPLYTCYFDFPDDIENARASGRDVSGRIPELEGAWIDGRLAAVVWTSALHGVEGKKLAVNVLARVLDRKGIRIIPMSGRRIKQGTQVKLLELTKNYP